MGCLVVSGDVWWKFPSAGTLLCFPRELDPIAGIVFGHPHCTLGRPLHNLRIQEEAAAGGSRPRLSEVRAMLRGILRFLRKRGAQTG